MSKVQQIINKHSTVLIQSLADELDFTEKKLKETQEATNTLEDRVRELEAYAESLVAQTRQLGMENESLRKELKEAEQEENEAYAEVERLRKELKLAQESSDELVNTHSDDIRAMQEKYSKDLIKAAESWKENYQSILSKVEFLIKRGRLILGRNASYIDNHTGLSYICEYPKPFAQIAEIYRMVKQRDE